MHFHLKCNGQNRHCCSKSHPQISPETSDEIFDFVIKRVSQIINKKQKKQTNLYYYILVKERIPREIAKSRQSPIDYRITFINFFLLSDKT